MAKEVYGRGREKGKRLPDLYLGPFFSKSAKIGNMVQLGLTVSIVPDVAATL